MVGSNDHDLEQDAHHIFQWKMLNVPSLGPPLFAHFFPQLSLFASVNKGVPRGGITWMDGVFGGTYIIALFQFCLGFFLGRNRSKKGSMIYSDSCDRV